MIPKLISPQQLIIIVKKEAQKFYQGQNGSHDWEHTLRVCQNCQIIGQKEQANLFVLQLAAYLHDIGRPQETKSKGKICHAQFGAQLARKILQKNGASEDIINAVVHCIEYHRSKGNKIPISLEAKILFDADKLDALGAIGIIRLFLFAREVGARIHNQNTNLRKTKAYTKEDTAFREFYLNERFLKDRMMTKTGKQLAQKRYDFMVIFFENLFQEINVNPKFFDMLEEIKKS